MDVGREKISTSGAYNLGSFETSPEKWGNAIKSLGHSLKITYEEDFRQKIADSWPKKIDDSLFRRDIAWEPIFDERATVKDVMAKI